MRDIDHVFAALASSSFRRRFRLGAKERAYLERTGLPTVLDHARAFVDKRLAPAYPANDGRQTPYRGHPAFVAQHATGTCCRGCLERWHDVRRGRDLSEDERAYVLAVLERWIRENA